MSALADILRIAGQFAATASNLQYRLSAQMYEARRQVNSVLTYLAFLAVGLVLMLAGLGFVLWGCWFLLADALESPGGSALIVGGALVVVSILFLVIVRSAAGSR